MRAQKKKARLPRSAANPLCRLSASLARTIAVIFISIAFPSDVSFNLLPPSLLFQYSSKLPIAQLKHAFAHTQAVMCSVLKLEQWMSV